MKYYKGSYMGIDWELNDSMGSKWNVNFKIGMLNMLNIKKGGWISTL